MSERIKIRCPNCRKDGTARAEFANRKVACKHCEHVFRIVPLGDAPAAPSPGASTITPAPPEARPKPGAAAATRQAARQRIKALEDELRGLSEELSAQSAEHRAYPIDEIEGLREQVARAREEARLADEARARSEKALAAEAKARRDAEAARARIERVLSAEAEAARDGLERAREEARLADEAYRQQEQALLQEVAALREQVDQTVLDDELEGRVRHLEDELRLVREDLEQARDAAEAEARGRREATEALDARQAEHDRALGEARAQLDRAHAEARALRDELDQARAEFSEGRESEARALREELEEARAEALAAGRELDEHRADRHRADSEKQAAADEAGGLLARASEEADRLRARLAEVERLSAEALARAEAEAAGRDRSRADLEAEAQRLRGELAVARADLEEADASLGGLAEADVEVEALRRDLDESREMTERLASEVNALRGRLAEVEGREAEATVPDRGPDGGLAAAVERLREELGRARAAAQEAETFRRDRDEARVQRDRVVEELYQLRARIEEDEQTATDWDVPSTVMGLPEPGPAEIEAEARTLRAELAEARERLHRKEAEVAGLARERDEAAEAAREAGRSEAETRLAAETEALRRDRDQALRSAEEASRACAELTARLELIQAAAPAPAPAPSEARPEDPAAIEADRRMAVDQAVKAAWSDFERRLSETQAKLKAANTRADLLEAEAREAREQIAAFQKGLESGEISSFDDLGSMTSLRILSDRGAARLTPADAEGRLALARQLAVERKDKALIDRIAKMAEKVRADLEARNYTLAETLVRGAEIEVGLDPGGYSINGLKIFRPSPSIVTSLAALMPAFDRVMRQGDPAAIASTIAEMRTLLGDQAGLPEVRRPGRVPAVKRPIAAAEATRLFLGALEAEPWLMRPISTGNPLPDTSLTTYATLIDACAEARPAAERHAPEKVELLDKVIRAAAAMLTRRQQADGHFSFLDPRGRPSKLATVVEAMVAQAPGSVKDGWVVAVDPSGAAQTETGACGQALLRAGAALGRPEWTQAALKAADWAAGQPCLASFAANAASAALLARAYLDARQDRHLAGLARKLTLGLLPGQVDNGRWVDAATAQTPNHLAILRALHEAWQAIPAERGDLREPLKASLDRAADSLLQECQALGVPAQGGALRDLVRHRDLVGPDADPRLAPAILDSATVVQELCHDGARPKLGVPPDQLAALTRV